VVFHIASRKVVCVLALELGKEVGGHLAKGVDQHVQAATVGHAKDHLFDTSHTGQLNELIHASNEALTALE
jgi:hypothetical protein